MTNSSDMSESPSFKERLAYGKEAEDFVLQHLKEAGYDAVPTSTLLGEGWTSDMDAQMGDIQILDGHRITASIDVKRARNHGNGMYGTITRSVQSEPFRRNPQAWYLLFNDTMDDYITVKADEIPGSTDFDGYWKSAELKKIATEEAPFKLSSTS